jgi:hypothetical protein
VKLGVSLLPDGPNVEEQTLNVLLTLADPHLQSLCELEVITVRCTIIEETSC